MKSTANKLSHIVTALLTGSLLTFNVACAHNIPKKF
jgi:hypothetical protein